jgi:NitT/TauT family transport system substrate-binding protein
MQEALTWAASNEDAVRAAIATNMKIPEEAAAGITLPIFTSDLNVDNLEQLADLAVGYGVLDEAPDFDTLIQLQ